MNIVQEINDNHLKINEHPRKNNEHHAKINETDGNMLKNTHETI